MQRVLALERSPPPLLSLRFFAGAPVFVALAALPLLWHGGDALASRWTSSALAATHLLTLGVLSMVMVGALLQILPVVANGAIAFASISGTAIFYLLGSGALCLSAAFLLAAPWLFILALPLLILALVWLVTAAAVGLWRSRPGPALHMMRGMRLALLSLIPTLVLGAMLGAAMIWPLAMPVAQLTERHVLWGLAGWVGLLVVSVSFQVIPMFQVTPLFPRAITANLCAVLFALICVATFAPTGWMRATALTALLALFGAYAAFTLVLLQQRRRPPEAGTWFWRIALTCLLMAMPLAMLPVQPTLIGILLLPGFAYSAVVAMLYKIVPFLLWQHWQEQGLGKPVPGIRLVMPEPAAMHHWRSHALALLLLALAALWPHWFTRAGALALLLSALQLGWAMRRALRLQAL